MKTLPELKTSISSENSHRATDKTPDTPTPIKSGLTVNEQNVTDVVVKTFANTDEPQV